VLIWWGGRIVPEEALRVPAGDRVFEHGLGLFETLRTWGGTAPLLPRHLARMTRSAEVLGLPLAPAALPDAAAVGALLQASGAPGDAVIRITLSGGVAEGGQALLWMRTGPLPPPPAASGAVVDFSSWTLASDDLLARHKTLNYWPRRLVYEQGRQRGADEVLLATPDGRIWEGTRTNLFLVRDGAIVTPGLGGPVLPGIMRALVLELAAGAGLSLAPCEAGVSRTELETADEVFLTNSVRGLVPVGRTPHRVYKAPGPWTCRLRDRVAQWLELQPQGERQT
jgi:branched-subunit amino acid aminotransferase/4-amino-4-deoxychorismate lyase